MPEVKQRRLKVLVGPIAERPFHAIGHIAIVDAESGELVRGVRNIALSYPANDAIQLTLEVIDFDIQPVTHEELAQVLKLKHLEGPGAAADPVDCSSLDSNFRQFTPRTPR